MKDVTTITVSREIHDFLEWCRDRTGLESFDKFLRACAKPIREKTVELEKERSARIFWGLDDLEPHTGQPHTE